MASYSDPSLPPYTPSAGASTANPRDVVPVPVLPVPSNESRYISDIHVEIGNVMLTKRILAWHIVSSEHRNAKNILDWVDLGKMQEAITQHVSRIKGSTAVDWKQSIITWYWGKATVPLISSSDLQAALVSMWAIGAHPAVFVAKSQSKSSN